MHTWSDAQTNQGKCNQFEDQGSNEANQDPKDQNPHLKA